MTINLGNTDRVLRAIIGLALILSPLFNLPAVWSSTPLFYASIVVGLVLVGTALFRFCPLYRIFGISSCRI
ncbi:DUF2892 domain-containing protein [Sulfitobacter sp. SK011]|jgi:hypothetical protein|uniref:YgaP family membrane protein n=1 Tax=Sulfitobacter TaxID=60136 RepID=UPI000E0AD945|nr:DUF2892 domain-containing protein [Sulfitobacter sp. SK011]AXI41409.1 DUF2892 domain-containing protein [Sulfitobacter sp. SK011]